MINKQLYQLKNVNPDKNGYMQLNKLYSNYQDEFVISFDLKIIQWFNACLCAPLGAILDKLNNDSWVTAKIDSLIGNNILQRNEFLSYYGFDKIRDDKHTTIRYLKLQPSDSRFFNSYITDELVNHPALPSLSDPLKKKITESIYEMFVNAQMHSQTKFIYTCGQFFPKHHSIWFSITDLGVGFKHNINHRFNADLTSAQAIEWAVKNGHTTKTNITGGIGLALLKEFIAKNSGTMQIVSGDGFYSFTASNECSYTLDFEFPGTIITMEFKTNDSNSYCLASEISEQSLF